MNDRKAVFQSSYSLVKTLIPIFIFIGIIFPSISQAQTGCTDPQATNFDATAIENDGSCIYAPTSYAPTIITELAPNLPECSGLAFFDNKLWTHLDGGNADHIYQVDTLTGTIAETVTISNADNKDWEDLAQDEEHLYIGDFGNNFGDRMDLRIYKIKKSNLLAGTPAPELIEFSFSDQTDFTSNQNAHNYDCEAFFYYQDSLHLFSKNWVDFKTRHYVLPTTPGIHTAELRDSLEVQGLITGADVSEDGSILLLGYNPFVNLETFLWLLFDFQGNDFFSGNKRRISLGSLTANSQVEGIVFKDLTSGFICSEKFTDLFKAKLLSFDISQFLSDPVATNRVLADNEVQIFPNPVSDFLQIDIGSYVGSENQLIIVDLNGRVVIKSDLNATSINSINVTSLKAGFYFLTIKNEQRIFRQAFLKN